MKTRREFIATTIAAAGGALATRHFVAGAGRGRRVASAHTSVVGRVTDAAGAPLGGARITLVGPAGDLVAEARSDPLGRYVVGAHDPGVHRLGAAVAGREFREVELPIADSPDVSAPDLALGPNQHTGRWTTIGDTSPEYLGATNSGTLQADGRLNYCHSTDDPLIFDPVTLEKVMAEGSGTAQGCHATTVLLDGRLLFVGGSDGADPGSFRKGVPWVKAYDPATDTWERLPDMNEARWYPTITRLPDGRLLVTGGGQPPDARRTDTAEIYDPAANEWTRTGSMLKPAEFGPSALLYSGEVLRTWFPPQLWNPATGTWRATGGFVQPERGYPGHAPHSLVLVPDGRAVAVGMPKSVYDSPSMVETYDPATEEWTVGASPGTLRSFPEAVLLPDGSIVAAGGSKEIPNQPGETNQWGFTSLVDLYDPVADTWRPLQSMPVAREYHALSILAPDGRLIVTAGTGAPAQSGEGTDNRVDAFEPPYMFRGPRPAIEGLSTTDLRHGERFTLAFSGTFEPSAVVLMGLNAVTHYVDGGVSRHVSLPFTQTGGSLDVLVPGDMVRVPAGHYHLFLMVDDIPSEGRIVRVTPPPDAPATPTPVSTPAGGWPVRAYFPSASPGR